MTKRILVADDCREFRGFVRETLERSGYIVHEADNGAKALKKLESLHFDMLVLDVIMPDSEGIEVLLEVRRKKRLATPVLMVSGGGRLDPEAFLALATKFGANRVMAKPFGPRDLRKAVLELTGAATATAV